MAGVVSVGDIDRPAGIAPAGSIAFARPKSSTLTVPSGGQLDVRRLRVAMNDALLVRRVERLGNLTRERKRLVDRNRPRLDSVRQRGPLDEFHHQSGRLTRASSRP